jgi:hypothetical protein
MVIDNWNNVTLVKINFVELKNNNMAALRKFSLAFSSLAKIIDRMWRPSG